MPGITASSSSASALSRNKQKPYAPSIFTLTRASGRSRRPGMYRLALRLYCEEPGALHETGESPYSIEQPTEWLRGIAPYLSVLVTVLKHAVPLAGPMLGITAEN
jgi:internalin A